MDNVTKRFVAAICAGVGLGVMIGITVIRGEYTFTNEYLKSWNLADKSSTLAAKQIHIEAFVAALERGNERGRFSEYDAIFLQTADNSFEANMDALRTLSIRLKQIEKMDPSSFEYNTAIQQITAQEQGEAHAMIAVLNGCYLLANYPLAWGWILMALGFTSFMLAGGSLVGLMIYNS